MLSAVDGLPQMLNLKRREHGHITIWYVRMAELVYEYSDSSKVDLLFASVLHRSVLLPNIVLPSVRDVCGTLSLL